MKCSDPLWGVWGANPNGSWETIAARDTAFRKRDPEQRTKLAEADVPVFEVKGRKKLSGVALRAAPGEGKKQEPVPAQVPAETKRWWEFWK